ncbi:DUF938 domain-containing protein [Kaarinaea lacus]
MKPYSESCDQNKQPILEVLQQELHNIETLLEIGSGTGQHAVFFGEQFPQVIWQTSDRRSYHEGILAWLQDSNLDNVLPPLELDVCLDRWPEQSFDAVFSANTAHIMSAVEVKHLFNGVSNVLKPTGKFILYGPFNYHGEYTSDSNAQFDIWLKQRDANSGIKDLDDLQRWATDVGLALIKDYEMPANNRVLVWLKQ